MPHFAFEFDTLLCKVVIFHLHVLHEPLEVLDGLAMLFLPLLRDFLLVSHHAVSALFESLVALLHLKHQSFEVCHLLVRLVTHLVKASLRKGLDSGKVAGRCVLVLSKGVSQLSQALVLVKKPLVVLDIAVKLNFLFVESD